MDRRDELIELRQLVLEMIEKYENAQLCRIESLGSAPATFAERRQLAFELECIRARVAELSGGDIDLETGRAA